MNFQIIRKEPLFSENVSQKDVIVYASKKKEPVSDKTLVILLHDGENFLSSAPFLSLDINHGQLEQGKIAFSNILIVAVSSAKALRKNFGSSSRRYSEYFPKKSIKFIKNPITKFVYSRFIDAKDFQYSRFIVEELKPWFEAQFHITLSRRNFGTIGISMGALAALDLSLQNPSLFGFTGCMSTHWTGILLRQYLTLPSGKKIFRGDPYIAHALINYVKSSLKNEHMPIIYFDRGTEGLDSLYEPYQAKIDKICKKTNSLTYTSAVFQGDSHHQHDWSHRFEAALEFFKVSYLTR